MTKKFIIYLSIALFIFAIFNSCFHIGFASTKNDHLIEFIKMDIDEMNSIDSVKLEAKNNLDLLKESRHRHSNFAELNFFILILLFFLMIIMVRLTVKRL